MNKTSKTKILIFGKNGQVASNLIKQFSGDDNFEVDAYSSSEVDFANLSALSNFLNNLKTFPDFIINAAAYTNVDKAEEERELADLINHQAVKIIAEFCAGKNIKLIHYSTDYVFDGSGDQPFTEDNTANLHPLNHYGKTKLDGENAIINSGCEYIILRTSWIYNETGKNFVNTIKRLALEREVLNVVDDQIGSPTSANFLAKNTIKLINKDKFTKGIYHLTSNRNISWYQFATEIVNDLKTQGEILKVKEIIPIKSSDYKTLATRPLNSRLSNQKIHSIIEN